MTDPLQHFLANLPRCTPETKRTYAWAAKPFLAEYPDPAGWTPPVVERYQDGLLRQGYAASSVDVVGDVLAVLFAVHGKPRLYLRRRCTAADVIDQARPALSLAEFGELIRSALASPWPEHRSLTALATVYGVRLGELGSLQPEYLDLVRGEVKFATLKRGAPRIHGIPPVLLPALDPRHFAAPRSKTQLWACWHYLEARAGIPRRDRQGWHAVRRGLTQALDEAGAPAEVVDSWLGWKVASQGMGQRYRLRPRRLQDEIIFAKHPVLPLWEAALGEVRHAA
jgi:integrase